MSIKSSRAEKGSISSKSRKSKTGKGIEATGIGKDEPTETVKDSNTQHYYTPSGIIVLRDECLLERLEDEKNLLVPHNSPRNNFIYTECVDTIPEKIKGVEKLHIPCVRSVGIKKTIEILADFFDCPLYKTSLLQFWFLDVLTDCLWKCQDEFLLNDLYQKNVLTWILYFFDMIRDPQRNLSRGDFFRLFREVMKLAEDYIQCGVSDLPRPTDLFLFESSSKDHIENDEPTNDSTDSSLSFDDSSSEHSMLVLPSEEHPEIPNFFKLPSRDCRCDISVTSSVDTLSEKSIVIEEENENEVKYDCQCDDSDSKDEEHFLISYSISEFLQEDKKIHSRFLDTLDEEEEDSRPPSESSSSDEEYEWVNDSPKKTFMKAVEKSKPSTTYSTLDVSRQTSVRRMRSMNMRNKSKTDKLSKKSEISNMNLVANKRSTTATVSVVSEQKKDVSGDDLIRAWFEYNLWEQRKEDMGDPKRGWTPLEPDRCVEDCICAEIEYMPEDFHNEEYSEVKQEWIHYLERHKEEIQQHDINIFVNSCLLLIIKQFVLDYFYETFQYKLVKMTYETIPNLLYETLNSKWQVPKENKGDFKRPVEKKPKPPKPPKEKKQKGKEKKKDKGTDKKSKSTKSKGSDKKSKKEKMKKDKKQKPTKEEKEERERLKMEEKLRREQEIIAEQNRRFIFPLTLAADEDFFKSIFEDYTPPALDKQKKPKGKDKKKKK